MRSAVLILALLAIGKYGYQEYMYRTATAELIIKAYGEQAMLACQVDALARNLSESYVNWTKPASISLAIGRREPAISVWDFTNPQWTAEYGHPTLLIIARREPFEIACSYDILDRRTEVWRSE